MHRYAVSGFNLQLINSHHSVILQSNNLAPLPCPIRLPKLSPLPPRCHKQEPKGLTYLGLAVEKIVVTVPRPLLLLLLFGYLTETRLGNPINRRIEWLLPINNPDLLEAIRRRNNGAIR